MGQPYRKFALRSPLMVLAALESCIFAGIPFLAVFILNSGGIQRQPPAATQVTLFAGTLLAAMLMFGLFNARRLRDPHGDALRTAWCFASAGALQLVLADLSPSLALDSTPTILGLLLAFFIQRTTRLVYFDAVELPGDPSL